MNLVQRLALVAALSFCTVGLGLSGLLDGLEEGAQEGMASLRQHEATGQLHIVEMDAASVAAIDRWPWPRGNYAEVIERLDAAGVRSIVFDVDFSSFSTPHEDQRLAAAIEDASVRIVLPTFAQGAGAGSDRQLDALPIPPLRGNAALGSVSVRPDADGMVREMPLGTMTAGVPRPSLSAKIAGRSGQAHTSFPIDFAIDPDTIPRHSFIAIRNGHFDPASLRGHDVLVGATAIEMGDRYVVPRHGVLPGVVVQALAAETLYRGVPVGGGWLLVLLLAAPLAFLIVSARNRRAIGVWLLGTGLGTLVLAVVAWDIALLQFEIVPALLLLAAAAAARLLLIAQQEWLEARLTDEETGLPNQRALLRDAQIEPASHTIVAALANYDAVKTVIGAADMSVLLVRIADRLRTVSGGRKIYRATDTALAWNVDAEHYELDDTLNGLKAVMRSPIEVAGRRIDAHPTFGVAEAGAVAEALHAAALATKEGRSWRYHQHAERAVLEEQVSLMGELDQAIERGELEVLYQPKLDLRSDQTASVEALVRWNHPERGMLRPDSFIPLAEQSDRIAGLTLYVLRTAIADLRDWCERGLVLKTAVNISARLISSPQFVSDAASMLLAADLLRERIIFEVTESATMDDPDAAVAALHRFRELGIAISMDDYGTGQSSLTYLRNLPLSELKIDRSFVQFAHRDRNDSLLVRSTVQLAHSLDLQVVAEGVEDEECLAFLRRIGCDLAQGYHIGRPMDAAQLRAYLLDEEQRAA